MSWLGTWANRLILTIDNTNVDDTLSNFPVTIQLGSSAGISDFDATAVFDELTSDANRKKIAITTSDGTTQCYVEIELWDDSNETAVLHTKVPSVASGTATLIYLYYDSAQSENTTYVGDTTDAVTHNVWDSNFEAVYHMAQDPNGDVADAIKDSTSNGNDGTPDGSMTTADLVDGEVGKAIDFDGIDDRITIADDASFDITTTLTVEAIVIPDVVNISSYLVSKYTATGDEREWAIKFSEQTLTANFGDPSDGTFETSLNSNSDILDTSSQYVGFTFDSGSAQLYHNGSEEEGTLIPSLNPLPSTLYNGTSVVNIGNPGGATYYYDGIIDEVRISSTARSAAWIKATYHSLWDSLITFTADANIEVSATTASLTLTSYAADIQFDVDVVANSASLNLVTNQANVFWGTNVAAKCHALTITTYPAKVPSIIVCSTAALSLSTFPSTISYHIDVLASPAALSIISHAATIWDGAAWKAWIDANGGKLSRLFYFTLTGDADGVADAVIPMTSWQARRKSGESTFLAVVVPGTAYESTISARSNGDMQIEMAYVLNGVEVYRETICEVDYEYMRPDEGGRNQSITLTGHRTETFTPKSLDLRDVIYVSNDDGDYRYRCATPDMYLNPGDTARYDGNSITVGQIVYSVSNEGQSMDVEENAS